MLLTILLMAGGSLVIAILPTYAAVGWLAPILLLLARITQGMSLGGEVSNASAYLAEIAPPNRRGRYSSFFYISTGTAVLLASLLGALLASTLADDQLANWGWRIPFLIGAGLGLVGMWMRRDMAETEQFADNVAKARAIKNPLMLTLREYPRSVGQLIGVTLLSTLCYYTFFSALTPFAVKGNGLDDGMVFWALSVATALFVALQLDGRSVRPQAADAPVVGRDCAADCADFDADPARGGLRVGAPGVLLRARSLRDEEFDRPCDHERTVPDRIARPGHRRLV
jgi:MHS family alpha-ketoglutarate permease-like MFS transporter